MKLNGKIYAAAATWAITALLLSATGCEPAPVAAKSAPLRVGAYYWPGEYWVDIAHHKGWFTAAGVEIEWVNTNADYFASFDALVDGKLDIIAMTLYDLLLYARAARIWSASSPRIFRPAQLH